MIRVSALCLIAFASLSSSMVHAQSASPLVLQTQLVSASGAPAATTETFTIAAVASGSTQPDLIVTLTDFQVPAPLASASVAVTQGATLVGMTALSSPATTATITLPAAVGDFTLRVVGSPNASAGVGTFSVCVAPKTTPSACIQSASIAGNITVQSATADPTKTTAAIPLTVTTAGAYTFTYTDEQFPVALNVAPQLALFQGTQPVAVPVPASPATITLSPGTYTLLAIAQADATAQAGLFSLSITGPAGTAPLINNQYPVGTLAPATQVNNPNSQSLTLAVHDFAFPTALMSATALVTSGAASVGTATTAGGAASFVAPSGALQVWTYGTAGTGAGTYEVDLTSGSTSLLQTAAGVNGGGAFAYAFISPAPLAAGKYQATANDFQFPATLSSVQFAVAQNDSILVQQAQTGSAAFTAAAGSVVLLATATPATSGSGLLDVNVQTSASTPTLVFDHVQPVSASGQFISQPLTLGASGNFDVTLTDLDFPTQFQTLALVGSSNGSVLGKIYGGGTFTLDANVVNTAGNYQLTVVGIPTSPQQYGLYGLQVAPSPPTVTLTASPTTVTTGGLTTLTWTTTNATSCTGTGGSFVGNQAIGSGSTSLTVTETTDYTLTCTGAGGTGTQSVTVTTTPAPAKSGGGGELGWDLISLLGVLTVGRRLARKGASERL